MKLNNIIKESRDRDIDELPKEKLNKLQFKFLRAKKGYFYFDVKGNSFLRGKTKTLPEDLWVGDWYKFSEFKEITLIKAENTKDIEIDIV